MRVVLYHTEASGQRLFRRSVSILLFWLFLGDHINKICQRKGEFKTVALKTRYIADSRKICCDNEFCDFICTEMEEFEKHLEEVKEQNSNNYSAFLSSQNNELSMDIQGVDFGLFSENFEDATSRYGFT